MEVVVVLIPSENLREAAARTFDQYVSNLISEYDPEYRHEFSFVFEKRIKKLKRRADNHVLYQSMRRIAVFILALLAAVTIWISVNADARAAFFGWIREITGSYFEYHHSEETANTNESSDYRPTWIPAGYSEDSVRIFDDKTTVCYKDGEGKLLRFSYVNTSMNVDWFFDISQGRTESCCVGECPATFFVPADDHVASAITWIDSNDTTFYLTGFVCQSELIRIAESVKICEKTQK